ncbi:MAG: hypothetical protein WCG05_04910 [Alphaproteobacteria bacterium]
MQSINGNECFAPPLQKGPLEYVELTIKELEKKFGPIPPPKKVTFSEFKAEVIKRFNGRPLPDRSLRTLEKIKQFYFATE